jgi:O-antigen/teichoic acid export membrane protein
MNVYAYVSIIEVSLKLLIVFMLTWITYDKLKLYGILHFGVVFIIAAIYRVYTRRNFEESKFEFVKDQKLYKTLISYSVWNLFGNIAGVAKGQGVNILLNIFYGPVVNAARGIAMQVQAAVNSFVSNFQMAVNPQIIKSYAADEREYMYSLVIRGSKFSFYLLFILSLPIMIEVDQILKLWLKTVPEYSSIFTILVLVIILIDCVSGPLMTAIQATGKIKVYQAVVGSLLMLILPISYFLLKLGYSPEITLYVNIVISIIALSFRLYLVWKLLEFPIKRFVEEIILKNILIVLLSFSLPLLIRTSIDEHFIRLIVIVFVTLIWNAVIIFSLGLQKSEKAIVIRGINKILKRT